MAKSPDAFRTISEVADWLDTQAHVLRFWESKFPQVKPIKRAGGRRYYRPADMRLLGGIKKLLHDDGMTIKGVQKMLRSQGVAEVSELSQPLDMDEAQIIEAEAVEVVPPQPEIAAQPLPLPAEAEPVAEPELTLQAEPEPAADPEPVAQAEPEPMPDPEPAAPAEPEPTPEPEPESPAQPDGVDAPSAPPSPADQPDKQPELSAIYHRLQALHDKMQSNDSKKSTD
ncbi:MAG: MerR family transcriptional regulator [Rhodobacterales bacterium]|nr:MAG: MerR family transcriptional regulator [Rhodobacterales bacterium]